MGLFVENGIVGTEERDGLKACPASLVYWFKYKPLLSSADLLGVFHLM